MCHIPSPYFFYSLLSAPGWRLWLAVFPVLPVPDTACPLRQLHAHTASFTTPPFICFGAAIQGHMVRTAIFVPHITPVRTICPAAPGEFLLLSFTTPGGMFLVA